jgi:hypothetical protein
MGTPKPRFGPPKLAKMRGIEEIPPRTPLTLEPRKPENQAPLLTYLGGELQGKKPRRVQAYIPHQIPKRKASNPPQEKHQERAPKITTKEKWVRHNQVLKNHAESSIHTMKVHTRSSLPPDHPSLSQDLTMMPSS